MTTRQEEASKTTTDHRNLPSRPSSRDAASPQDDGCCCHFFLWDWPIFWTKWILNQATLLWSWGKHRVVLSHCCCCLSESCRNSLAKDPWAFRDDKDALDNLLEDLADRLDDDEADVYEVMAILRYAELDEVPWYRSFIVYKCFSCAFLQTIVAPIVVIGSAMMVWSKRYGDEYVEGFVICHSFFTWELIFGKIVSASFAVYVFVQYMTAMNDFNHKDNAVTYLIFSRGRMERKLATRYIFGVVVNLISLFWVTVGSFILLYISDSSLEMVLNALALGFLNDVDDKLASHQEMERAKELFAEMYKKTDSSETRPLVADPEEQPTSEESVGGLYKIHRFFCAFKYFTIFASCVTLLMSFVAPWWLFVCWGVNEQEAGGL